MQPPKTPILPHWPLYKSPVSFGTMERVFCCITFTGNPDDTVDVVVETVAIASFCPELDEAEFDPIRKIKLNLN